MGHPWHLTDAQYQNDIQEAREEGRAQVQQAVEAYLTRLFDPKIMAYEDPESVRVARVVAEKVREAMKEASS